MRPKRQSSLFGRFNNNENIANLHNKFTYVIIPFHLGSRNFIHAKLSPACVSREGRRARVRSCNTKRKIPSGRGDEGSRVYRSEISFCSTMPRWEICNRYFSFDAIAVHVWYVLALSRPREMVPGAASATLYEPKTHVHCRNSRTRRRASFTISWTPAWRFSRVGNEFRRGPITRSLNSNRPATRFVFPSLLSNDHSSLEPRSPITFHFARMS